MTSSDIKVDQQHQLWQEGSHPRLIDSDEMMWQKVEYIHNNPVRRGYVDEPVRDAMHGCLACWEW